ncbi:MAG TPA: glycosyltransferase family 2 protein, partial [Verrucomicrobiae bacterium]|nr:glycosyltransferase family 2 protein [Verrucomicrobiae bacterium]
NAEQAGADVLRHPQSLGKGAALRAGWRRASELGFEWAMTLDGDGQHAPDDIPVFLQRAEQSNAELLVGNRMSAADDMPWLRRFVNRWMSRRISALAGCDLPDSQCGFRLINLAALNAVSLRTTHFEIESEVLLSFIARGFRVEFVPVRVIYQTEQSKIRPLADTVRWFRWWSQARPDALRQKSPRLC